MEDDTKKLNYINKLNEDDEFIVVDEKATIQKVSFKDFKKNLKLSASTVTKVIKVKREALVIMVSMVML